MRPALRLLPIPLLAFLAWAFPASAGLDRPLQEWVAEADYDPAVPSLDVFLGRTFAERHTSVDEIFRYAQLLADSSDRVSLERMGESVQGDPLLLLVFTDPRNRPGLKERSQHIEVARDPWNSSPQERRRAAQELLPVTWIACSVHGDEASGSDAGLALAYHLAADRSEATQRILRDSVVLISPSQNPDGRRRFLQHVRSYGRHKTSPDPSPWAAEHNPVWPGGRTNHFLFDLNRDWAFLTQQESRYHVSAFLRWRPQVFVDLHEMGRDWSYFFPPPAEPINPNVPLEQREWFEVFGRANASAFDQRGFDYFVREDFDLFYPGYGDSWPTLQGAIGMTYEQATTRGRALRQRSGYIAGYGEAVERHFLASWTTLRTVASHPRELIDFYVRFHEIGLERSKKDSRRELLLSVETHGAEATRLAETLVRQGIEVLRTREDVRVSVRPYDSEERVDVVLPAGSYRVPFDQPAYPLLRSLLDPHTPMEESFLEQERERRERGLNNRFYDVTAWSMVFTHGVLAYTSSKRVDVPSEEVSPPDGPEATIAREGGVLRTDDAVPFAWVIPYRDNGALEILLELWQREVKVWCSQGEFVSEGKVFPRGSLVVKSGQNADPMQLGGKIDELARQLGVTVHTLHSAWTDEGPSLGSGQVLPLRVPRVGMLTGPGLSPQSAGGLQWLLEDRYGVEFTSLLLTTVSRADLAEFDVIVMPEVREPESVPLDLLDRWVRGGGLLVAVGSAIAPLLEAEDPWSSARLVSDLGELADEDGTLGGVKVLAAGPLGAAETEPDDLLPPERRPLRTPGAILRLRLDASHYLTLGEGEVAHAPLLSDRVLLPTVGGRNVGRVDEKRPRVSGFMWPVMEEAVKGKGYVIEEERGRGHVVLFAEDPGFRGTWEGLHRLLLNGVLLGPSMYD